MAELIGGSGYDDVQNAAPSNPSIGDTWFDTSTDGGTGKIYADLGNGADWQVLPVQDELQSGRTRELLLLLQDDPIPEVVDPLNLQTGLSQDYQQVGNDYQLPNTKTTIEDWEDGDTDVSNTNWNGWFGDTGSLNAQTGTVLEDSYSGELTAYPNGDVDPVVFFQRSNEVTKPFAFSTQISENTNSGFDGVRFTLKDSGGNGVANIGFEDEGSDIKFNQERSTTGTVIKSWSANTQYDVVLYFDFGNSTVDVEINGTIEATGLSLDTNVTGYLELRIENDIGRSRNIIRKAYFDSFGSGINKLSAYVTDQFAAPTTGLIDFAQWNAIQARDVTTGGSTSTDPVEFEILDSTDTAINSSRIPKAQIADEPFVMRNRVYSEDAGSNGQSDFTIATTGDGGHFGIPVLTVVSVKKNGSVLDSANWSFDPDTDTVTIDTSNVTIASGDTIDIKYDFDVFDSTLKPRAYLNRESGSETSPSISHFRYEYVI